MSCLHNLVDKFGSALNKPVDRIDKHFKFPPGKIVGTKCGRAGKCNENGTLAVSLYTSMSDQTPPKKFNRLLLTSMTAIQVPPVNIFHNHICHARIPLRLEQCSTGPRTTQVQAWQHRISSFCTVLFCRSSSSSDIASANWSFSFTRSASCTTQAHKRMCPTEAHR